MKKLLFVLAVVAVYGLSITSVKAGIVVSQKAKVTIVAGDDNPVVTKDDPQKTDVKKVSGCMGKKVETKCEGKKTGTGCCAGAKSAGCCSGAKTAGCCQGAKEVGCAHAKECTGHKEMAPVDEKK